MLHTRRINYFDGCNNRCNGYTRSSLKLYQNVCLLPADNLLSISGKRNRLSLFDINSRAFIFDMETEWACPSAMTFMADKVLACGFTTGEMQVVDLESRSGREKEQHSDWAISGISFNTRSQLLLGIDGTPVLRAL